MLRKRAGAGAGGSYGFISVSLMGMWAKGKERE